MQIDKCSTCGAAKGPDDARLTRCSGCPRPTAPRYCSRACQITGWLGGHKQECGASKGGEGRQDVGASTSTPSLPSHATIPGGEEERARTSAPAPVEAAPATAGTSPTTVAHPQQPDGTVRHKGGHERKKEPERMAINIPLFCTLPLVMKINKAIYDCHHAMSNEEESL